MNEIAEIERLRKALQEIDAMLKGTLPITAQVKKIAREALNACDEVPAQELGGKG